MATRSAAHGSSQPVLRWRMQAAAQRLAAVHHRQAARPQAVRHLVHGPAEPRAAGRHVAVQL